MVHPFAAGRSVNGESNKSNLHMQVAPGELCLLASRDRSGICIALSDISFLSVSSMFVDMLVAARYKTTVVGVHFGSSEGARVPARVCCGVLAFRRFCMCCDALDLV